MGLLDKVSPLEKDLIEALAKRSSEARLILGRPMSCVPGYFEVINTHTIGSLTIPRASIKWV